MYHEVEVSDSYLTVRYCEICRECRVQGTSVIVSTMDLPNAVGRPGGSVGITQTLRHLARGFGSWSSHVTLVFYSHAIPDSRGERPFCEYILFAP